MSKAITTEGQVIDVFTAAGLPKPDIGILSDQFLAEVRGLKHKNVAAELLEKLLKDELKVRSKRNLVQSQVFSEKLKKTLNAYHNRAISTMQVIEELIKLAKDLDAATRRGEDLGLTDDEIAFYDALAANDSAVQAMGDAKLKLIAAELITQVKKSVTIDWTLRESARAKIKVMVKRILNKHGYPPDLQEEAVKDPRGRTPRAAFSGYCVIWEHEMLYQIISMRHFRVRSSQRRNVACHPLAARKSMAVVAISNAPHLSVAGRSISGRTQRSEIKGRPNLSLLPR
ncbi:MAG: DUF3387 domain-containing protein [Burkholderiaceae bacterium]|nr:DUF3387 domain-containing protein [Burkholderiaceae bacterium]